MIFSKEKCCFLFPVHKSSLLRAILISFRPPDQDHAPDDHHNCHPLAIHLDAIHLDYIHPDDIHPDDSQIDVHRPPKSLCSARRTRKPLTQEELHSQRDQGMMVATFPFLFLFSSSEFALCDSLVCIEFWHVFLLLNFESAREYNWRSPAVTKKLCIT